MIIDYSHIVESDKRDFDKRLAEAISGFQDRGFTVEIQYEIYNQGLVAYFTALVIGRR